MKFKKNISILILLLASSLSMAQVKFEAKVSKKKLGVNERLRIDFEMNKGGAVIFDELGVHRGAMPSKHSRLVLRYFYRRKI